MNKERHPLIPLVLTIALLATLLANAAAQELQEWASIPSDQGVIEVLSDGPPLLDVVLHEDPASLLQDTINYEVHVSGEAFDETAAQAVMHDLLDTIDFLHLWNYNALGYQAAYLTPYTEVRGEGQDTWTAHYPFTVAREDGADTNQSRALLDEAPGKAPGLDNQRVRRNLWRDVLLDTAMLGTLRETLGGQDIHAFTAGSDPRIATRSHAATAFSHLRDTTDALGDVAEVPSRLSDVVTLARRAGIPAQTVQRAVDASLLPQGLTSDVPYRGFGAVRQGSPFDDLLTHTEQLGLGLDILSLASQVTSDAFDGIAMQLAANHVADTRLTFLETLLNDDCTTMSNDVDVALCDGLGLAREEFDALSDGLYTGIAYGIGQAMTDTDSLLTYAGLTASITGHIATLASAGALSTTATVAGAGVLVFKSLSSIAGEFQLVRRAFLLAHLNHLLQQRAEQLGGPHPSDMTNAHAWQTAHLHTTIALTIEWMYFHTLHQGYSASRYSPAGLFHNLTQWIHGSANVVDDLNDHQTNARNQITTFQPLPTTVTIQTTSTNPSDDLGEGQANPLPQQEHIAIANHSLALDEEGTVWAWGWNADGQVGNGAFGGEQLTPVQVDMPDDVTVIALQAGITFSLALDEDGNAWSWGGNSVHELGDGTTTDHARPVPVDMPDGVAFTTLSAGLQHSLALDQQGMAWAWGANYPGRLGDGTTTDRRTPVQVDMPDGVTFLAISAGRGSSFALDQNGNAWAWGNNSFGQLGDGTTTSRTTPVQVDMPDGVSFTAIQATISGKLWALDQDGRVFVWGNIPNSDGEAVEHPTPVRFAMSNDVAFKTINAGGHSFALDQDGQPWAWGRNYNGQLGDGTTTDRHTFGQFDVPDGVTFTALQAGLNHSLALDQNGNVWAWGANEAGQVGDGTTTDRPTPVQIELR